LDDSAIIPLPLGLDETFQIQDVEIEEHNNYWSQEYIENILISSEYKSDVLVYIAGYFQQKIIQQEECIECKFCLTNLRIVESSTLLNLINRGPLCVPFADIVKIVKISHILVERWLQEPNLLT
jgi:hypothetical protein